MQLFLILLLLVLPIAWLVAEFRGGRALRCTLGVACLLSSFAVAYLAGTYTRLNYNIWYGDATKVLVDKSLAGLEAGDVARVRRLLRQVQTDLEPRYESRGHYNELVREAINDFEQPLE